MSYVILAARPAIGRAKLVATEKVGDRLAAAFVAPDHRIKVLDPREETLEIAKRALASKKGEHELLDEAKEVLNSGIADIEVERSQGQLTLTLSPSSAKTAKATLALVHTGKFESSSSEKAMKLPMKGNSPLFAHLVNNDSDEPVEVWDLDPKDPRLYLIARKGLTIRSYGEPTDRFVGAEKPTEKLAEEPAPEKPIEEKSVKKPAKKTKAVSPLAKYFANGNGGPAETSKRVKALKKAGIETIDSFMEAVKSPKAIKDLSAKISLTQSALKNAKKAIQAEESI